MVGLGGSPRAYYKATLAPEVGVASNGRGLAFFTYNQDIHILNYLVSFEGLTGPAVAAHIHGPAKPGTNAAPIIDLFPSRRRADEFEGVEELTGAQAAALRAGKYYVTVETVANKGGEIRGQIVTDPSVLVR